MARLARLLKGWTLSLAVCAAVVSLTFWYVDVPLARRLSHGAVLRPLGDALASSVILLGESAVVLTAVLLRLARGRLSPFGQMLVIASITSMCAYGFNDALLKPFFGVPAAAATLNGAAHAFNLGGGMQNGAFPSGHMALAGGFAGVFMRLKKVSILPMSLLLMLGAGLLLVGGWHFLSDLIAGVYLGLSAGLLAGEAWASHTDAHSDAVGG
ncbi:MAG TPA: phosphatase PAP2 family protein [Steroidobacteraceae bacterium]|nr:phosphatase PAP2 family protein [Steroidobacteraceae bacterium]